MTERELLFKIWGVMKQHKEVHHKGQLLVCYDRETMQEIFTDIENILRRKK